MYVLVLVFFISGTPAELIIKHSTPEQCSLTKTLIKNKMVDLAPYIGKYAVKRDCEKV